MGLVLTNEDVDTVIFALARAEDDIQDIFDEPLRASDYSEGDLESLSAQKERFESLHERLIESVATGIPLTNPKED